MKLEKFYSFPVLPFYKKAAWSALVLSVVSILIVLLFDGSNVSTFPVGWEKSYPITPYDINIKNIRLAQKGNIIAVVYEGEKDKTSGIYISISFDKGNKFFQPLKIASISSKTDRNPDISISADGHIAAVWQELSDEFPDSRLFCSVSRDMGAVWTEPQRLGLQTEMELLPRVLYDERGRLHIFYNAYKDKGFNLFHITSEDEKIFSEPESLAVISDGIRGAFFPAIAESGSYMYVVWQGKEKTAEALSDDLYFIKSANSGKTWSQKKLITRSRSKDSAPYIKINNNDIYLVYQNDEAKNWAIKMMKGSERGDSWSEPETVSTTNADCYSPKIIRSDDDNLFVIWYDARNKTDGVFARKYSPSVLNAAPEAMLSRAGVSARKPVAMSAGRRILVFWEESGRLILKSSDIYVDPPVVNSQTHPENSWSKASRAVIKWKQPEDESNITGYATFLKRSEDYNLADIDPSIPNVPGNVTQYVTPELSDGISYFYIRAIDGAGNYSRTVRYKIQISRNPPSMPVVSSETHPDGKASESATAVLNWKMEDRMRLKGFLYALSKNVIKAPEKFTPDFNVKYDNLSEGRYFFSIRSVDKTNALSPVVAYEIIVGVAEKLDPEIYSRLAKGIVADKSEKHAVISKKEIKSEIPSVELSFPFDISNLVTKSSFEVGVKPVNVAYNDIIGYSYSIGKEDKQLNDIINLTGNTIKINDLKGGEYYLAIKARYSRVIKGKKEYLWTNPFASKFRIEIPLKDPLFVYYVKQIALRVSDNYIPVSMSLIVMFISLFTLGFGTKLSFYTKMLGLKFTNVFRIYL